ncbi:MAG: type II toxin-antitoxin system VapC family toxin [Bacillota bacterium]|nr:type II toxin-antitoxin system VapC family toxin [Bacillota bacterium]
MILIDTDICIHILCGSNKVIEERKKYPDQVAVSFMTLAELYYGAEKSANPIKNRSLIEQFLLTIDVINSDNQIMHRFGLLKASLENLSLSLADADLMIAATALEKCNLLVTGNLKHFGRIDGLLLANWIT